MRKALSLVAVCVFLFAMGGCVSSSKFEKKTAEADSLSKDLKTLQQQYRNLTEENNALKDQHKKLTSEFEQMSVQSDNVTADRDELDRTPDVVVFADHLEAAAIEIVEAGVMTGDLLLVADRNPKNRKVSTDDFIDAAADRLRGKLYA